jgi:hypothetical protein
LIIAFGGGRKADHVIFYYLRRHVDGSKAGLAESLEQAKNKNILDLETAQTGFQAQAKPRHTRSGNCPALSDWPVAIVAADSLIAG